MFGSIIGVATISGDTPESLILAADRALYIEKQGKKPSIFAVSGEIPPREFDADQPRLKLESYLPNACIGAKS